MSKALQSAQIRLMHRHISDRLRHSVRAILLHDWDPIGVGEIEAAADEYDSYVESICRMLLSGADSNRLAEHLVELETGAMGLSEVPRDRTAIGRQLVALVR